MSSNSALTIEDWIVDMTEVTFTARAVYSQLVALAKKQGFAWPSQQFLANRLGVSLRTISSCIGELVKAGFVDVARPTPERSTCAYTPKVHPKPEPDSRRGTQGYTQGGTQSFFKDNKSKNKNPP
jgi:DNA-binding transcriptional MocR family regulator